MQQRARRGRTVSRVPRALARALLAGSVLFGSAAAGAQAATCEGDTAVVQRGDTISAIAERCGVSERRLLSANPTLSGSADLRVGEIVRLRGEAPGSGSRPGFAERLDDFTSEAAETLGRVAGQVGSSVDDLLDKNPDLRARLERLGRRVGIGDGKTGATATVLPGSAPPGATVRVAASGLPASSPVTIGAGPPGAAAETVATAQSSPAGTLDAGVVVPAWAGPSLVFSVRSGDVRARTDALRVER